MKKTKDNFNIKMREAVDIFRREVMPIIPTRKLSPETLRAVDLVDELLSHQLAGWANAGVKRDEKPSKTALYFRWRRARKVLAEGEARKLPADQLAPLREEAEREEREYRAALAQNPKSRKSRISLLT